VTTHTTKAGIHTRRMLAVAAVAAIAISLALTMRVALANDLHQAADLPISWQDAPQGTADECKDANLDPGQVLWHFVHTGTDGNNLPATLDATFTDAGPQQADGYSNGGGNAQVMYDIITGQDTLESASDSINDDNLLNLSHVCVGAEQSVAESVSESTSESVSESVAESASGNQSVEAGTGTPAESQSNTAFGLNGSSPLPTIAFSLILLASLGALAYANVKSVRNIS
jgi:hypothetical protein